MSLSKAVACFRKLGGQFHDKVAVDAFRMEFSDEVAGRFHRSSRSEKIVVEEYHVILIDGVFVNLNGVDAVFFGITLLYGLAGRLAGFSAKHDSGAQSDCGCRAS